MAVDQGQLDHIAGTIAELYQEVEASLIKVVADELRKDLPAPTAEVKLDAIRRLRTAAVAVHDRLVKTKSAKIREAIATAYRSGFGTALSTLPADAKVREDAKAALDQVPNVATIERIAAALHRDLGRVEANILRAPLDAYRAVQAATAARIATGTVTRLQASQAAWKRLMDKGIVNFPDKAGRTWRLSSYTEMIARTNVARAATQGQLDRLESLDIDLVYIGDNVQECKVCRPFESKVLRRNAGPIGDIQVEHATQDDVMVTVHVVDTIAGASAKGLFHPNCRHSASIYLPGLTKLRKGTEDPEGDVARQRQRALERKIRAAKENALGALTPKDKQAAGADVRAAQAQLRAHLAAHPDLKRLPYRESIGAGNIPPASGPKGGAVGDFEPPQDGAPTPAKPKPDPEVAAAKKAAAAKKKAEQEAAAEQARLKAEQAAQEKAEAERAEAEWLEAEADRLEAERLAQEEVDRAEAEWLEAERLAEEEAQRAAKEQAAAQAKAKAKAKEAQLAIQAAEKARLAAQKAERDKADLEARVQAEKAAEKAAAQAAADARTAADAQAKTKAVEEKQKFEKTEAERLAAEHAAAVASAKAAMAKSRALARAEKKRKAEAAEAARLAAEAEAKNPATRSLGMQAGLRHRTNAEGLEWAQRDLPMPADLTKEERSGLRSYTGETYQLINNGLRGDLPRTKRDKERYETIVARCDSAFAKASTPEAMVVHRQVAEDFAKFIGANIDLPETMADLVGKDFVEKGYVSTSVGQSSPFPGAIHFMMRVPQGYKAMNVMPISQMDTSEREVLINRGSRYIVHAAYKVGYKWHIEAELVPEDWQKPADWKPDPYNDADEGYSRDGGAKWQ